MEIARWYYSCCVCLPGCKNAKETLLLLLCFQQLLTFYCNLFLFSLLLKNNIIIAILIINQHISRLKDLSVEDYFCQQRVSKLGAHGRLAKHTLYKTQPAAHHVTLSATLPFGFLVIIFSFGSLSFPMQGPNCQLPAKILFQPVFGVFFDGFLLPPPLLSVRNAKDSHKP